MSLHAAKSPASLCFLNAKVYTVDDAQPFAEAVVTEGNRIAFVGSNAAAKEFANGRSRPIDLEGRLVLPGFIDDHTHFVEGGMSLRGLNLRDCRTTDSFRARIGAHVSSHRGGWVTGGNWDHESWERNELPTKELIDPVSVDTPVFVQRFDGHMALANSVALHVAGVSAATPDPPGGRIERDTRTGEPTGILKDTAMGLVASRIPKPGERELVEAIDAALCEARKQGITSIHDITLLEQLPAFQKLDREGKLTCRVYARLPLSHYRTLVAQGIRVGSGTARLRLGSVKAFCDGSLGSSTAWFFEPYEDDTSNCGLAMDVVTDGSLRTWAMDADRNGLQLSVHAIGDRANATVLSLFQEIRGENPPWDRRFRIEHAQHVRPDDIPRFRELDVIVSAQPYHCIDDGVWAERKIGPARGRWAYPFGAFLKAGVRVCFGSDWTVAPLNTLAGMYAAMTRQPIDGGKPDGWHPEEKISVRDAIRCYTLNNAYASFEENTKGSITPGKLADLVVLKENILECDPSCVRDASVLMTVFDGTIL